MNQDIQNDHILIHETFFSIQGEGFHTGKAAFFVRFAGCDIGCKWCDSKDAWNPENAHSRAIKDIVQEAVAFGSELVVITGGEPLYHDLTSLTSQLRKAGKKVHLETSGTYPLQAEFDWLTLSPKRILAPDKSIFRKANELKIIVNDEEDFEFCEANKPLVNDDCILYIQPQWTNRKKMTPLMIDFIREHPEWRLSLQVHKYLEIP